MRPEFSLDFEAIDAVERAAFGRDDEAAIVRRIRKDPMTYWSWVADDGDKIVGHALFSLVKMEPEKAGFECAALGPIAVLPEFQRRGVGSALVKEGVEKCKELTVDAIFLVGDPAYYRRFGFELAAPRGFHYESHDFDRFFQVLELKPNVLEGRGGWVEYPPAFRGEDPPPRAGWSKSRPSRSPRHARRAGR